MRINIGVSAALLTAVALISPSTAAASKPVTPPDDVDCGSIVATGLMGVAAVSSSDAWSVGDYLAPLNTPQTLIEHWDGSTWTKASSPDASGHLNILMGVTALSASNA